jgi:hypothetical protein
MAFPSVCFQFLFAQGTASARNAKHNPAARRAGAGGFPLS